MSTDAHTHIVNTWRYTAPLPSRSVSQFVSRSTFGKPVHMWSDCQVCARKSQSQLTCPNCKAVHYCSSTHRKQHWRLVHHEECSRMQAQMSRAEVSSNSMPYYVDHACDQRNTCDCCNTYDQCNPCAGVARCRTSRVPQSKRSSGKIDSFISMIACITLAAFVHQHVHTGRLATSCCLLSARAARLSSARTLAVHMPLLAIFWQRSNAMALHHTMAS